MKKIVSILLALVLVFTPLVCLTVLADESSEPTSSVDTSSEEVSSEEASSEEVSSQEVSSQPASSEETSSQETSSNETSSATSSETSSATSSSTSSEATSSTIGEEVVFEGDFTPIKLIVGHGSEEDLFSGVVAKETSTGKDLTSEIYYVGTVNFNKKGDYPIIYRVKNKTGAVSRLVKIVEDNTTEDLVHRKTDDGRNYFQDIDFESVRGTSRNLVYQIYTDSNYRTVKYSWRFAGKDIGEKYPTKMSVTIYGKENCANANAIKNAVGKVEYKILSFECGTVTFPAKAEITVLVDGDFTSSDSLYLYQYSDKKLVLLADSLKPNGAGYITYSFSQGGDYVLTNKKAGYQETTSSNVSSTPVSSTPVSSEEISSDVTSEITSSTGTTNTVSSVYNTSSQDINPDNTSATTVLLIIVLCAIGLMLVTVIAFAAVHRNAR